MLDCNTVRRIPDVKYIDYKALCQGITNYWNAHKELLDRSQEMRNKNKSLVRGNNEMTQRKEKCFVDRWVSKCYRNLQKICRLGQNNFISLSCQYHSFGHSANTFPLSLYYRVHDSSCPTNNYNYLILVAYHIPSFVLSTLHTLFNLHCYFMKHMLMCLFIEGETDM